MNPDFTRAHRFAVYFAPPPDSAWWSAGSRWLGRCAATNAALAPPPFTDIAPDLQQQLTADPRRYGWHGTLKAPFSLAEGVSLDDVRQTLRSIAASFTPFEMPELRVRRMGDFLALGSEGDNTMVNAVANTCMRELDKLRAALSPDELARRRQKGSLSPQEDALLLRWGYPYVFESYRFHMSITGNLQGVDRSTVERLETAARAWFGALPPCCFDGVALFCEPTKGAAFVLAERWEFGV